MTRPTIKDIVAALLDRHGTTYSEEIGIDLAADTPAPLFQWLSACILFSARISADQASRAARSLFDRGLTTPRKMADAGWKKRVEILNENGYARFDESTASMMGETADMLLADYDGDLRKLRSAAGCDPAAMRRRLKAFKGLGDVGVDICFREIQTVWTELQPFADAKSLEAARALDLGESASAVARHVGPDDIARVMTALVRASLAKDIDAIRDAAA
ncbi:hypothetical protein [Pelagibacterium montanilacus]|uniref:hypothetical protein n=1 Tax=Pelagibacterium montanilacus TaxID=2185280 RepID=UPI000F8EF82B|nr:hypothetical protein [Pelagibacterium montanilacus]